jgi:LysM repeat protein
MFRSWRAGTPNLLTQALSLARAYVYVSRQGTIHCTMQHVQQQPLRIVSTTVLSGTKSFLGTDAPVLKTGSASPVPNSCSSIVRPLNAPAPILLIECLADVNAQCTSLQLNTSYCVLSMYAPGQFTASSGPPSNLASGSFTNCTSYHIVASGDTCNSIETAAKISASDFLQWNPEVNIPSCTNIQLGAAYCVGGGGNQCSKTYTVVSGDFCSKIETSAGITEAQLKAFNRWLDSSCSLQVGQILCVGPPAGGSSTTPSASLSSTTSTTRTTIATSISPLPTNLASGSWRNCTTYCALLPQIFVAPSDSCLPRQRRLR